ncbi:mannitol 2-dehydrogenase [Meinhardsimonia xiamenensis]|jgi:mannitol 2-dehydrogenase|uniref:Mannitol 2-dehydrogenase n=1 Tax=Meinhardsimonia xiamenensis TaxID=990712 RepID=A0A1G9D2V1_9RHOB|nr:mannitol dehydrogenase family protein [Meinhardsimonia xiamenensis]PRX38148.1 mannitol 2-dehydrogenase [Meinhardsimonia xiamenensis]SDK58286.1 mannitol 2-dehydrogenase [Meinhardsimonia xiamenensis]
MTQAAPAPRPVKLCNATLAELPAGIERPRYDRARLRPGIVHIGVGNFHRAHQAWYLHRLMQEGAALDWAILGAGVRAADAAMREKLLAQDCLTTLIELAPDHRSAEVIGAMSGFLPVQSDNAALIAAMADPAIRIVSLTVTEGGYFTDAAGGFDAGHPDIRHDAASPDTPRTAFGAIVAALARRRAAGHGPFTVMSCDNLRGNGAVTRATVTGLAQLSDPVLAGWIEANVTFPNAMVDCIVPATGPEEIALARAFGIDDAAPVTHENYRQWVMEEAFCAGRPEWERAGVTISADVHGWETMKIRILNAGHQVLANAGELLSIPTIADCMADSTLSAFFGRVEREEIVPHVRPVEGMTPEDYLGLIIRRFSNPAIRDTTRRVAFDGSSRHRGFVLPILRDRLAAGGDVRGLALVEALWARMCAGTREDGSEIAPNDPQWQALNAAALAARADPSAWLEQRSIYGDLAAARPFAEAFGLWLGMLWQKGVRATLEAYLKQ